MKEKTLKQAIGIDVAQKELVVQLGRLKEDLSVELYAHNTFPNHLKGFKSLLAWVKKHSDKALAVSYVLEATGVYHEPVAYFLEEQGLAVHIVLPNKISSYMRTLDNKTVTDLSCAEAICRFGLERKLEPWQKPAPVYRSLRQLTRERDQLVEMRTMSKNMLHAEGSGAHPCDPGRKRLQAHIAFLDKQIGQIHKEIEEILKSNKEVKQQAGLISTICGIGQLTAVTLLAETSGFDQIRNKRQLTSYAGLDIREKLSGTSVKGKPRISKRGNKHLRKCLHLPALTAIRHDQRFKAVFERLVARHGIKMKAVVAIQRKLLEIAYAVYKTGVPYDKGYLVNKQKERQPVLKN
jgi:transposase